MTTISNECENIEDSERAVSNLPPSELANVTMVDKDAQMLNSKIEMTTRHRGIGTKRTSLSTIANDKDYHGPVGKLRQLLESDENERYEKASQIVFDAIDGLIQEGLHGFHKHDNEARRLESANEELDAKDRELQRLRASEESSRETILNLLQAVETAKNDARDSSRHAHREACLRSEIMAVRLERDEALGRLSSLQRKTVLLEGDMQAMKQKMTKQEQQKIKMERDHRASMSLAKSVGQETSTDIDFYKRKTSELQNQLSTQLALINEQKCQIDELRRSQERSMSQNRLAQFRSEEVFSKGRLNSPD